MQEKMIINNLFDDTQNYLTDNSDMEDAIHQIREKGDTKPFSGIFVRFMNSDNRLLVPVVYDGPDLKKMTIKTRVYNNENYAVCYTSMKEAEKGESISVFAYFLDELIRHVLIDDSMEGIILNPEDESVLLHRTVLQNYFYYGTNIDETYDNAILEKAIAYANRKLQGMTNSYGLPFIIHYARTMAILSVMAPSDRHLVTAAVLHSLIEHTDTTETDILSLFGRDIKQLVLLRTRSPENMNDIRGAEELIEKAKKADLREKLFVLADVVSDQTDIELGYECQGDRFWKSLPMKKEELSWYYSEMQDLLYNLQFHPRAYEYYWKMVNTYKDLFVKYAVDENNSRMYMFTAHHDNYVCTREDPQWNPLIGKAGSCREISREQAEMTEDQWKADHDIYHA